MSSPLSYPLPRFNDTASVFNFGHLDALRQGVSSGQASADQERQVAEQFEALLLQQWLKQARQTITPSMFDSDQTRLVQGLSDEQMAMQLASRGVGLAQLLLDQIRTARGDAPDAGVDALPTMAAGSSRVPGLRDQVDARPDHAPTITALIDRLTGSKLGGRLMAAVQGAPGHIRQFVAQVSDAARLAAQETGVHEKLILGQAALESGWGRREILRADGSPSYNLFGIKATGGWKGEVAEVMTTEYVDGEPRKLVQPFRAYGSYQEAFSDYARLIGRSDRYRAVVEAGSAEEAARRVQEAGYATDPAYADKLISIMAWFDAGASTGTRR